MCLLLLLFNFYITNKLQSDLIHNISHDLKTPIAIIRYYSECMKDDVYPYGDKNSSLDIVIENADRLEKKVKDFLYLNRLDYLEEKDTVTLLISFLTVLINSKQRNKHYKTIL